MIRLNDYFAPFTVRISLQLFAFLVELVPNNMPVHVSTISLMYGYACSVQLFKRICFGSGLKPLVLTQYAICQNVVASFKHLKGRSF